MKRQLQFNEKVLFEWHSGVTAFWTANPGAWFKLVEELFHTQEMVKRSITRWAIGTFAPTLKVQNIGKTSLKNPYKICNM